MLSHEEFCLYNTLFTTVFSDSFTVCPVIIVMYNINGDLHSILVTLETKIEMNVLRVAMTAKEENAVSTSMAVTLAVPPPLKPAILGTVMPRSIAAV